MFGGVLMLLVIDGDVIGLCAVSGCTSILHVGRKLIVAAELFLVTTRVQIRVELHVYTRGAGDGLAGCFPRESGSTQAKLPGTAGTMQAYCAILSPPSSVCKSDATSTEATILWTEQLIRKNILVLCSLQLFRCGLLFGSLYDYTQ